MKAFPEEEIPLLIELADSGKRTVESLRNKS